MSEQLTLFSAYLFFGLAVLLAILEMVQPASKPDSASVNRRWGANLGLYLVNASTSRFLLPLSAAAVSEMPISRELGLLHQWPVAFPLAVVTGFLALDLLAYFQHRLFHAWRPLWRLHLIHHTDVETDFTTTVRHHPVEVVLGTLILYGFVVVSGIPALSILLYVLAETVVALLSHANLRFPAKWERVLSLLLVTPAVHAVHHSASRPETDSNFGTVFTLWDRMFSTYRKLPDGQVGPLKCGLEYFRAPEDGRFLRLLWLPLRPIPAVAEETESAGIPSDDKSPCRD